MTVGRPDESSSESEEEVDAEVDNQDRLAKHTHTSGWSTLFTIHSGKTATTYMILVWWKMMMRKPH